MTIVKDPQLKKTDFRKYDFRRLWALIPHFAILYAVHYACSSWYENTFSETPTALAAFKNFFSPINLLVIIFIHVFFCTLYYFRFGFVEKYKANSVPWPWVENFPKFRARLPNYVRTYFVNSHVIVPLYLNFLFHFRPINLSPQEIPSFWRFYFSFIFCVLGDDFWLYWSHRLVHHPRLYHIMHKKHHEEYNVFHLSSIYTHWSEFIFSNTTGMLFGYIILGSRLHVVSMAGWTMLRNWMSTQNHCGYEFPFELMLVFPFTVDSSYHNHHHLKNNGNFAGLTVLWDYLFATNGDYLDEFDRKHS